MNANTRDHDAETLTYLRKFTEAVLAYTGAAKVDMIGHSMGVTLGRRVVKGGNVVSSKVDLGASLVPYVDTFLGLAGANLGLVSCGNMMKDFYDTCNDKTGFYPGTAHNVKLSAYLQELNVDTQKEGEYVVSALSTKDDLIMYGDKVFGFYTSQWPTEQDTKIYDTKAYTHIGMRDMTVDLQYNAIVNHQLVDG